MASDKEPKAGGENLVPDDQAFNFDAFFDNTAQGDSGGFPVEEPAVETELEPRVEPIVEPEPVAETVDSDNAEEVAEVFGAVEEPVDAAPPVDELSDDDKKLWATRRFLDRLWVSVAGVGVVALIVANVLLVLSPPAVCSFNTKLYFFTLFNIIGLVTVVGPLVMWRAGAGLDIRKDREKEQLAVQEKKWLPNMALSLAMVAVCVAVMVLLVEFYQYDFTITAK